MRKKFNFNDARDRFLFGSFWNDDDCRKLSVLKEADVLLAINKAYIDMTPRTIVGLGLSEDKIRKETKKSEEYKALVTKKSELINELKKNLAQMIVKEVFDKEKFDDTIHKNLCDNFIKDFKEKIQQLNNEINKIKESDNKIITITENKITYGKAQKIVNMAMKYLYFFDDADDYVETVFNNCHMAIDEYIMKFFDDKGTKRSCSSWSNFDYEKYEKYREAINKYCKGDGKIPFFAEFEYWNKGKAL